VSIPEFTEFLLRLDGLKLVERRTYINGGERRENSAEHSWQVAIAAWALANYLGWDVSVDKLLRLALVHDLGELGAGDTFLYSADRAEVSRKERVCVAELADEYGAYLPDMLSLWDEQELGETPEARLLKVADRLLPFLHNVASEGKTWREHGIARSQVLGARSSSARRPRFSIGFRSSSQLPYETGGCVTPDLFRVTRCLQVPDDANEAFPNFQ
jgi:putative hydrolase of HD superfamily